MRERVREREIEREGGSGTETKIHARKTKKEGERGVSTHLAPHLCLVFVLHLGQSCAVLFDETLKLLGVILL